MSKKIVLVTPVYRAGGMKLPAKTVTPFVATYVSPAAIVAAADIGARAYIRVVEMAPDYREANDIAFWATDRKIRRLAKDSKFSVKVRAQFRVTNREAGIWEGSPPCGQTEYFDAIPDGYQQPFLGGRAWLWPALVRLGWKAPNDVVRAKLHAQIAWERKIANKRSFLKETRDDARASIKTIEQLL
jgi:hypothetical protein